MKTVMMSTAPLLSASSRKSKKRQNAVRHAEAMEARRLYKVKRQKQKAAAAKGAATRARNALKRPQRPIDAMSQRLPGSGWTRSR
jgi:hypothetical protein